jgi:Ala-tRNA(Pro) deacylase
LRIGDYASWGYFHQASAGFLRVVAHLSRRRHGTGWRDCVSVGATGVLFDSFRGGNMTALERCLDFLDRARVPYSHSTHPAAFTAHEVAAAERMPVHNLAKTVIYCGDNGFGMLLLPADYVVEFPDVLRLLGLSHIRLATEIEVGQLFPDSELGAMGPIPNTYEMPILLDEALAGAEFIAFNAGTHRDVIHMSFVDFIGVANPLIASFAVKESMLTVV